MMSETLVPGEEKHQGSTAWFLQPTHLNWLMSQPEDLPLLVAWVRAIAHDQDSLDEREVHVRGLGRRMRQTMDKAIANYRVCFSELIAIVLVYLHITPHAQAKLPEKDVRFMLEFKFALGQWLLVKTPEGLKYSKIPGPNVSTDTKRAITSTFVAELRDSYHYKWAL
jgi:hypothetical protein